MSKGNVQFYFVEDPKHSIFVLSQKRFYANR